MSNNPLVDVQHIYMFYNSEMLKEYHLSILCIPKISLAKDSKPICHRSTVGGGIRIFFLKTLLLLTFSYNTLLWVLN